MHPRASGRNLKGLFFVGTDTGVGKTFVTAAVARCLRQRGRAVRVCKPVATGDETLAEDTRLLAEAAAESDEAKRAEMYKKAEAMLAENPPFIEVNNAKQVLAARKRVKGFVLHPTGVAPLYPVDVSAQ